MTNTATLAPTRYFGRCIEKGCKHRIVWEGPIYGPGATYQRCPDHRVFTLDFRPLKATYNPAKECNARCMGAIGPACDCSCGGENHGTSSL